MKQVLWYTAVLVGIYLVVSHASDAGKLLSSAGTAYTGGVKVLQGR